MAIFEHGDISIEVDEDGFMQEPDLWNEVVAAALATTEGVDELTDEHWKVVNLRRVFRRIRDRSDDPEALQGNRPSQADV